MMFLKNYCTEFMILLVRMCITLLSTIFGFIIFQFSFVLKISLFFVGMYE